MYLCSVQHNIQGQAEACHLVVGYFYAYMCAAYIIFGYLTPWEQVNALPTALVYVEQREVDSRFSIL